MSKKLLILATVLLGILVLGLLVRMFAWPRRGSNAPAFFVTDKASFRVISARYVHGRDLEFPTDNPIAEFGRRLLDRFGIHVSGSREVWRPFSHGVPIHAIEVLCQEELPNEDLSGVDAQCITESGQVVRLTTATVRRCFSNRVYFIFHYSDANIGLLHLMGWADADVTNFCPRQLCIRRKSDHHELSNLELSR